MIRKMRIPHLIRVRGIDDAGMIRQSRVFQQSTAAWRFAIALEKRGYVVRVERASDITFELVGGRDV